ncbi:hypothetical protein [Luteimicrobium subarcticum]|uniref:Flp pilus assembly pilin Flp n=1 Tax=Luteimicrobium subarcticum TaxID=620910 RepID=A0A2M8WUG2_9MICO|nr:hypothetical protein [Luteimicrobium subarcticum]PJI94548.1 hypothetical protein CLV34_0392 [Luteimicrobium subarcticum]
MSRWSEVAGVGRAVREGAQEVALRAGVRAAVAVRRARDDRERGDVPGWVLVTLMTAGLVVALWAIAGPALSKTFSDAISSVKGP